VCDRDADRAAEVAAAHDARVCAGLDEFAAAVDAAVVAVPTSAHFEVAAELLARGVHCLVEKPLARTPEEGRLLTERARERGVCLMVGHVERFNPAVVALLRHHLAPRFVEAQRVSPFAFRSTDIGVVLDMMIHDIDLILHLVASPVKAVHAVGVGVIGAHEDLANVRLIFDNGAVANATASRLALKKERTLRLFAPECYASLDLMARRGRLLRPGPGLREGVATGGIDLGSMNPLEAMTRQLVEIEELVGDDAEPLALEDREFIAAIGEGRDPAVTGEHGVLAMETAEMVVRSIRENLAAEG
jgi:predicted dehydrogenase